MAEEEQYQKPVGEEGKAVIAKMYEHHRELTIWGLANIPAKTAMNVLDVGCGGGMAVKMLALKYPNAKITGIDISSLNEEELAILYAQARYCQAMTDADIDTMRELVSEDMVFTHMSGMQQTREEYFADVADGSLNYFTIGIADPVITVEGEKAQITYTSVLNANAYGARGTFRMKGTHHYEKRDGAWIAVNR